MVLVETSPRTMLVPRGLAWWLVHSQISGLVDGRLIVVLVPVVVGTTSTQYFRKRLVAHQATLLVHVTCSQRGSVYLWPGHSAGVRKSAAPWGGLRSSFGLPEQVECGLIDLLSANSPRSSRTGAASCGSLMFNAAVLLAVNGFCFKSCALASTACS